MTKTSEKTNEVEAEREVRARIERGVDELMELMAVPGLFSDEELDEDVARAEASARVFVD